MSRSVRISILRFRRVVLCAAGLLALAAVSLTGGWSQAAGTASGVSPQSFFRSLLIGDPATNAAVVRDLLSGSAFVDSLVTYADLTGDGRNDAIVRVGTGGAAGTIAVYVFSTDGQPPDAQGHRPLVAVYRNQGTYRSTAALRSGQLVIRTPLYSPGDDLCCPRKLLEKTLAWRASDQSLHVRSTAELSGPA